MNSNFIYLLHILAVGPLFTYAGYKGRNLSMKEEDKHLFTFILFIGLITICYHTYKLYLLNSY